MLLTAILLIHAFNSTTFTLIQKSRPYTGNLNSETSGDSNNMFLRCGDILSLTVDPADTGC